MTLEVITQPERLRVVEPQWTVLVESAAETTPFHLPAWLLTWWDHFGSGSLHVLAFWESHALAGVVPCFRHEWEGKRQLTLIGSGISDYLDPIMPEDGIPALQAHLDSDADWDICVWQDLAAGTHLQKLKNASAEPDMQCSETRLDGDFEHFWATRSKDLRRNQRRYSQKARELGEVEFEAVDEASPELLNALIRLHTARWKEQGEPGMIAANRSEGFLRSMAAEMARQDVLRFFAIRFRGEVVAVVLCFRHRNKIYAYMSAFDPDYETLGFGRTLLFEGFRHAYAEGYDAWNFLRGDEPYKASWGAVPIPRCRVIIRKA